MPVAVVKGLSKKLIISIDIIDKINATINVNKKKITFMNKYIFEITIILLVYIRKFNSYYFKNNNYLRESDDDTHLFTTKDSKKENKDKLPFLMYNSNSDIDEYTTISNTNQQHQNQKTIISIFRE
jgi:hypothetical protein